MNTIKFMDMYTLNKELGAGSYGTTYLCTQVTTGKHYACKCIPKCKVISQEEEEMVVREVDILTLINLGEHPNIVALKDFSEDDDYVYIVMELCEGGTLWDHMLLQNCTFDEPRDAQMVKEIASAIDACHAFGIVHRDLKLANLMFQTKAKGLALKLIDFGLAQYFEHGKVLTDVVGTHAYTAPEVIECAHGPKADIWSLRVVLYILLTGFYPFRGHTFKGVHENIMKDHDLFSKDPWPHISKGAKDLLQKMLTCNVNERLSALEVLKHPWVLKMSRKLEEDTLKESRSRNNNHCKRLKV